MLATKVNPDFAAVFAECAQVDGRSVSEKLRELAEDYVVAARSMAPLCGKTPAGEGPPCDRKKNHGGRHTWEWE
jgi:hypothetical protein